MLVVEHVKTRELAQVENEKEIMAKELIQRNDDAVSLKVWVTELQQQIVLCLCRSCTRQPLKSH